MAELDAATCVRRLKLLQEKLRDGAFGAIHALEVHLNKADEDNYAKNVSLMTWLYGFFLSDTIMVVTKDQLAVLATKKKIEFLSPLQKSELNVELIVAEKKVIPIEGFGKLKSIIAEAGGKLATVPSKTNDEASEIMSAWLSHLDKLSPEDVTKAVGKLLSVKEDDELACERKAAQASAYALHKGLRRIIMSGVEDEKRPTHSSMAEKVEAMLEGDKFAAKLEIEPEDIDSCYTPIVQSGGKYNLKPSAVSDDSRLKADVVVCSVGLRYKGYCANVGRTYIFDPQEEHKKTYEFLLELQQFALSKCRPGTTFSDLASAITSYVKDKRPDLEDHLPKNYGFLLGIEFKDSSFVIKDGNDETLEAGMVLNLLLGFQHLEDPKRPSKTYAVQLIDTVEVKNDGDAKVLTEDAKKEWKDAHFDFEGGDEEDEAAAEAKVQKVLEDRGLTATRTRHAGVPQTDTDEQQRKQRQRELAEELKQQTLERLERGDTLFEEKKRQKQDTAYKSHNQFPKREAKKLKIFVDKKYEAVILPIFGIATPFHISAVKNLSQNDEGEHSYLRINFNTPGIKSVRPQDGSKIYLKEITYRSNNSLGLQNAFRLIKDLQKRHKQLESERKELEDLVEQDDLRVRTQGKRIVLRDVMMFPNISKRTTGTLEAHMNGFRFQSRKGDSIDFLYSNIKHAFYQPPKKDNVILLHFHLKNAILVGKKQHKDLQFYTEIGETVTDLGQARHRTEREEMEAEQRERRLRKKLQEMFESFFKAVEAEDKKHPVEFDVPFYDLGFHGVPHKTTVYLMPTSYCLVALRDAPPFVLTLNEVERVHFERVDFKTRNFDMVFIFKDYSKKPAAVGAIPIKNLEAIKDWVNSCDIKYTEGPISLNWNRIYKTIKDDLPGFLEGGGFSFLDDPDEESGAEEEEEEDEGDDEFQVSEEELEESESDEYGESDEDFDAEEEEEESMEEEDDEEGESWDDLEREAAKADRRKELEGGFGEKGQKRKAPPAKHSSKRSKRR